MAIPIAVARIIAITQGRTPKGKKAERRICNLVSVCHTAGDNESVPSDIQPFNSEKIFYCISVQFLVSPLFSVYPQHTVTDADMRLNVLWTVLLRLQLFAQCRHKYSQGSNIFFPAAAPNLLRDIGMCQNPAYIPREQA